MGIAILVAYCAYFLTAVVVAQVLYERKHKRSGIVLLIFTVLLGGYWPLRMALHRPQYYWDGSSTAMDVGCEGVMVLLVFGPFHLMTFVAGLAVLFEKPTDRPTEPNPPTER